MIDGPRGRGDGRDPLRRGVLRTAAPRTSSSYVLIEQARRARGSRSVRTSTSAPRRGATPAMLAARTEFETRVQQMVEVDGETGLLLADPGPDRGRRHGGRAALPRRPVHDRGRGRRRATSAAVSSASRPPTSSPTTASSIPGHGVYAAFANGRPGGGQRRRSADLRERPRGADRDLPDRLRSEDLYGTDAARRLRREAPAPSERCACRHGGRPTLV